MARKGTLQADLVALPAVIEKHLGTQAEFGKQFPPGSMERRTWDNYMAAARRYEEAVVSGDDQKIAVTMRAMFREFDLFSATEKHTIHIPIPELTTVLTYSLSGNNDAMPGWEKLTGKDLYREAKLMAHDLIAELREHKIKIFEDETLDPDVCDNCMEEAA